jgi:hypothetical protein
MRAAGAEGGYTESGAPCPAPEVPPRDPGGQPTLALFTPTKTGAFTITCDFHPAMRATLTVSPKLWHDNQWARR